MIIQVVKNLYFKNLLIFELPYRNPYIRSSVKIVNPIKRYNPRNKVSSWMALVVLTCRSVAITTSWWRPSDIWYRTPTGHKVKKVTFASRKGPFSSLRSHNLKMYVATADLTSNSVYLPINSLAIYPFVLSINLPKH